MSIPRDGALIVTEHLLNQRSTDLYERFLSLSEKFQYRDLGRAVADAIQFWVEAYEHSDTMRPPKVEDASPDATLQAPPSIPDDSD